MTNHLTIALSNFCLLLKTTSFFYSCEKKMNFLRLRGEMFRLGEKMLRLREEMLQSQKEIASKEQFSNLIHAKRFHLDFVIVLRFFSIFFCIFLLLAIPLWFCASFCTCWTKEISCFCSHCFIVHATNFGIWCSEKFQGHSIISTIRLFCILYTHRLMMLCQFYLK